MPKKFTSDHFIRQWRKHRGLSLEQLGELIGMTHQNLGKIERGVVPYNQALLELLAEQLQTTPAALITRDPKAPMDIMDIYNELERSQQVQLIEIAKTIKRTAGAA